MSLPPPLGSPTAAALTFSVCTLVTKTSDYEVCRASFVRNGFRDANTEFLWIDNVQGNRFDGYSGIAEFIRQARGKYVIVCHQDVELMADGYDALVARLSELDRLDPNWALAGNSGLRGLTRRAMRITDPIVEDANLGPLPLRVDSLDENFLVIKAGSFLTPSADLSGFHFYGLDLCLQAGLRGHTSYVIDFHLRHKSGGQRSASFYAVREALERKYAPIYSGRIVRTTCDLVFLGWCRNIRFLRWPLEKTLRAMSRLGLTQKV